MSAIRSAPRNRLAAQGIALGLAGALALSACGQADNIEGQNSSDNESVPEGEASIRWAWWGSDTRHELNQDLIKAFEEEHPDITVTPDFTDWGSYWDKLATQVAGGDTPDVIMMEMRYIREYADRGVLADLNDYDVETSAIDDGLLGTGQVDESLYAVPTGVNVSGLITNPKIFTEAGVELPDDENWTWSDYLDLMSAISANTPDGTYGTQDFGFIPVQLRVWLRQHGASMWTEEGGIGFEPELLAEFWQFSLDEISEGAAPPAGESVEVMAGGVEQSFLATNKAAIGSYWSNQLATLSSASGSDMQFLRYPGETEYERTGMYLKPAMHLAMSADTQYPEAAATFLDWLLNSQEAAEMIGTDRGLRANLDVRESTMDDLDEYEQQSAEFIEEITPDLVDGPVAPPAGAGEVSDLLERINEQVLFEKLSPQEGAEQFIAEAESITG